MKPLGTSWGLCKFVTYLISKNTVILDIKWCISINLNIFDIIYVLVYTYRVVFIHIKAFLYYVGFSFCLSYPLMTQGLIFSMNRTKNCSRPQAFTKVTYHGFFKCEGKCYPNTQLELCWKIFHHHPSMTTIRPLVMKCPWTISALWAGMTKA